MKKHVIIIMIILMFSGCISNDPIIDVEYRYNECPTFEYRPIVTLFNTFEPTFKIVNLVDTAQSIEKNKQYLFMYNEMVKKRNKSKLYNKSFNKSDNHIKKIIFKYHECLKYNNDIKITLYKNTDMISTPVYINNDSIKQIKLFKTYKNKFNLEIEHINSLARH